ncbi:methyltransferase domain-containing protein [Geobacter pickeringii]|uniref:methyltransferase domain-containing protein n=1 Tax=Geobacter pickeringii TaxID=345632 RepID=UPI000B1D788E|nr:methyltransferase domain-containing protein [Geobacter pickeringii]
MRNESLAMQFFLKLGFEKVAWSLRRLHCPVDKNALVLEVGSGGNPFSRSNVLLDAYEETRERHWAPLTSDRPTVLGFAERLPFQDKSFDFVIACHVLEHSSDPAKFLSELKRVAKAGYIEVPDAFMERINPYRDHRLEITVRNGELVIRKKSGWMAEPETVELYEDRVKPLLTGKLIPKHPFAFHVRFYWEGTIPFKVVNPETDATWQAPVVGSQCKIPTNGRLRSLLQNVLKRVTSQKARNQTININELLQCTNCAGRLEAHMDKLICKTCDFSFPVRNRIPVMYPLQDIQCQ